MATRTKEESRADPALQLVLDDLKDALEWHEDYVRRCDKWYRAYRAILDDSSPAAEWTFKLHPPYAKHIAKTILANLRDEKLRFKGRPRPRLEEDMQYLAVLQDAARAQEYMIASQLDRMKMAEKQRPFYLQNIICGLSGYKAYWRQEKRKIRKREQRVVPTYDDFGQINGSEIVTEIKPQTITRYDDPYAEVVDMRDFWWRPRGARDIDRVQSMSHRIWVTVDEIREKEADGTYKKGCADKLTETKDFSTLTNDREQELFKMSRTKGMVEVIERWTRERVITIANRQIVLADTGEDAEGFPFWHGDFPFIIGSIEPDLFLIPGTSVIDDIMDLQEALWSLTCQRLDNTELLNNAVLFYREGINPDDVELAPGAQNSVPGNPADAVYVWSPNAISAQVSIPSEQSLRGDMESISAASPSFSSGADSNLDRQETATGVSILTTLAQRILAAQKGMGNAVHERLLEQMAWLDRQFLTQTRVVDLVGARGASNYFRVRPEHFEPDVAFEMEPADEALMRDSRIARSQALLQMALESALPCQMSGEPLNIPEFVRELMKDHDITDPERFFMTPEQAAQTAQEMMGGAAPGGGGDAPVPLPNGNGGVTSPLAAGPLAPSNALSISPVAAEQRLRSMGGRQN